MRAGVEMELNGTDVGGDDSVGASVAVVLGASYREGD